VGLGLDRNLPASLLGFVSASLPGDISAAGCFSLRCLGGHPDGVPLVQCLVQEERLQQASLLTAPIALTYIGGGALAHRSGRALSLVRCLQCFFTDLLKICGADLSWLSAGDLHMALFVKGSHCFI